MVRTHPQVILLEYSSDVLMPSKDIISIGNKVWKDFLVGFFLDKPLSYMSILYRLKRVWRLKGEVSVKSNGFLFLLKISSVDDCNRVVEVDPIILRSKLFIIKPWDASVVNSCGTARSVPVWIKLSNIPLYAWSHYGINRLASRIGRFLCMDESIEKLERITCVKCLIEVTPDRFPMKFLDGSD